MLNTVFVIVNSVAVISCENYTLTGIKAKNYVYF